MSMGVGKNFHFKEGKYLEARADVFNILNHANYALSNGNVFSTAGVTTATTTQGYVLPTDPNFLHPSAFFSGGIRSMTPGLKFVFSTSVRAAPSPAGPSSTSPFFSPWHSS